MKPKSVSLEGQSNLYQSRLDQILNLKHPLFILAKQIRWEYFEKEFGAYYVESMGRPGLPVRLVVGLHYLKHTYNESDESVVERFLENPYWQYFCGYEFFQHELPLDPSSLVKWRQRVGRGGMEKLLKETIETAKRKELIKKKHIAKVNVDTTVQEKAIAFPTDARLYHKMRESLVREAKKQGIQLRQSYERLGKKALFKQGSYSHSRKPKKARKETRKLRSYLGRVIRDIRRKVTEPDNELKRLLLLAERISNQQMKDKNKVYSVHAPEVECISKGKAHRKYEFGCKVSMVSTSKENWIVAIDAVHGNPYDGHTLEGALNGTKKITGWKPQEAYCDKGYRGVRKLIDGIKVCLTKGKKKSFTRTEWKWLKRRSAIEPIFSHLKSDNRMERNYLKGKEGDRINAILSGCGFNMRKLIRAFLFLLLKRLSWNKNINKYPIHLACVINVL